MKYIFLFTLLLMSLFYTSCKQNKAKVPEDNTRHTSANFTESQLKEAETSRVPVSMVRNVMQARNGDIFIASYLGVFRYNGTAFTNITSPVIATRSSSFWDVLEDRNGNLWFGTKDSGVYCYNGRAFQHFTTKDGLASNQALHLYEDRAGNIWIGASRYDGKSFRKLTTEDGFPGNSIRLLLEDRTGKLWFGAQGEDLFVYDGKAFTVLKNKEGKAFNNVWSVIEDRKGNIWFGDVDGLWRYDGRTFTMVSERGAYSIIQDRNGNIWTTGEVNLNTWALSRYDAYSLYSKKPGFTEIKSGERMAFLGIVEARDGSIWFGSGTGVHRYDGKTVTDYKNTAGQK